MTTVDDVGRHGGSKAQCANLRNWQSMYKAHNDRKTAREEGGFERVQLAQPDRTR